MEACIKCGTAPRRENQRYCRECHAEAAREYRSRQKRKDEPQASSPAKRAVEQPKRVLSALERPYKELSVEADDYVQAPSGYTVTTQPVFHAPQAVPRTPLVQRTSQQPDTAPLKGFDPLSIPGVKLGASLFKPME